MKLTMVCASFVTKYRISNHVWNLGKPGFLFINGNSIAKHFCRLLLTSTCRGSFRHFHSTHSLGAKSHQERENEYAHSVMEKLPSYAASVVRQPIAGPTPTDGTSEIVRKFSQVTKTARDSNLNLEREEFQELVANLAKSLPRLTDDDIVAVLHLLCHWPPSPKSYSRNFKLIWNSLDFECCSRLKGWDVEFRFLVADYWFSLRLSRITQYNVQMIFLLSRDLGALADRQVVQLMFYVNLQRRFPQGLRDPLQKRLASLAESVTLEELGVVCLGYFKAEIGVDDQRATSAVAARLASGMDKVNTVTVAAVLKFLRKSMSLQTVPHVSLLHRCVASVPNLDIPTAIHVALLSAECHVYHPLLLDTVARKVAAEMESARIKDCTKLLQCLSHFNHYGEPRFHELFRRELDRESRQTEIEDYPRDLSYTCLFYAYLGRYDHDLLRTALDPEFVRRCCEKFPEMENMIAETDYCVGVECPDYTGPRFPIDRLWLLSKRRGNLPAKTEKSRWNLQTRIMVEILDILELIMGKQNVSVRHILPHFFSPDIVVRLSGGPDPLSDVLERVPEEDVLVPPSNETWACFVVASSFSFAYKSKHLTGSTAMKLRQLGVIGYKTVFVPFYEVPMNDSSRKNYVQRKLEELEMTFKIKISNLGRK